MDHQIRTMSLTREMRIKGLAHEDFYVRSGLLESFQNSVDAGVDVTHAAIEAIARYRWDRTFVWSHQITGLPLDQQSIDWLIQQLADRSYRGPQMQMRWHIAKWFSEAPVALIEANLNRFSAVIEPDTSRNPRLKSHLKAADDRLELSTKSDDACLTILDEIVSDCQESTDFPQEFLTRAERLCRRLADSPDRQRISALVDEWLEADHEYDIERAEWRAGMAVIMAGCMEQKKTVPRMLQMLEEDWDWWNGEIENALVRMGTPDVVSQLVNAFPELPDYGHLVIACVLKRAIVTDAEKQIFELIQSEKDDLARVILTVALVRCGTDTAVEEARLLFEKWGRDRNAFEIAEKLYAYYRVQGIERPEFPAWREQMEAFQTSMKLNQAKLN